MASDPGFFANQTLNRGRVLNQGSGQGLGAALSGLGSQLFGSPKPDPALMAQLPHFEEDRARLGGLLNGHNPFAGQEWGGLISQLQQQASGQGPSVAANAYRNASQDNIGALSSMARGSASPAAAREAMMQQSRVGQGMAQGFATARTQEQMGAQSALAGALGQRDQLNQNAYLQTMAAQLGLSEAQLRAMLGNQQYAAAISGQPTGLQKGLGAVGGAAAGLAKL